VVRLQVAGAGCDFEVTRGKAFQRTPDGAIGVSPIANLEWADAPEPMKKALAGIVSALAQDPSLQIRRGDPVHDGKAAAGAQRNQLATRVAGGVAGAAAIAALVAALRKRRKATPAAPPAP
jgi:hypothetical protein